MHPAWSYPQHHLPCQEGSLRGKRRPGTFEGPSPLVFLLSPICNPCFPLVYKREAGHPTKETDRLNTPCITSRRAEQQPSSQHPFDLSIRDLGSFPLSPVCNLYYESFCANNTSSSHELNVGTFCPNQYKPCVFLVHYLNQTRNNTNLFVHVQSKHRHDGI